MPGVQRSTSSKRKASQSCDKQDFVALPMSLIMHTSLSFDGYTSYSESSILRAPSPLARDDDDHDPSYYHKEPQQLSDNSYYCGSLQDLYGPDCACISEGQNLQHVLQSQQSEAHGYPTIEGNSSPSVFPAGQYPLFVQQPHSHSESDYNGWELQQHYLPVCHNASNIPRLDVPASHIAHRPPSSSYNPPATQETHVCRRPCFNCHIYDSPRWYRSVLDLGKILCKQCGPYERAHHRRRPCAEELRANRERRKRQYQYGQRDSGEIRHILWQSM